MAKIAAISFNTFKEAIRNRILYLILIFALLILGSATILSDLAISDQERIIKDLGLASINFFGILIAVFVGIGLVYNELDKKTIYTIMSKPIDRYQFILGKYFGLLLTILVNVLIMTLFFFFTLYFRELMSPDNMAMLLSEGPEGELIAPGVFIQIGYVLQSFFIAVVRSILTLFTLFHHSATHNLLTVVVYGFLELAIITAFAVLYSTFTSPTLSAVFTVLTFVIGRLNEDIMRFAWMIEEKGLTTAAAKIKYWLANGAAHITPNLQLFNKRALSVYDVPSAPDYIAIAYAILYTSVVLLLATLVFRRKDFK